MRRIDIFAAIVVASLLAASSSDILLLAAAVAGEPGEDRIAVQSGSDLMSWYGHELKLIGPNSIGVFREGSGNMVGVKSCRCSSDGGSCTPIVAEIPHYAFCAKGSGDCAGECTVE